MIPSKCTDRWILPMLVCTHFSQCDDQRGGSLNIGLIHTTRLSPTRRESCGKGLFCIPHQRSPAYSSNIAFLSTCQIGYPSSFSSYTSLNYLLFDSFDYHCSILPFLYSLISLKKCSGEKVTCLLNFILALYQVMQNITDNGIILFNLYDDTTPFSRKYCAFRQGLPHEGYGNWTQEVSLQVRGVTHSAVEELQLCRLWDDVEYNHRATIVQEIAHINFTALTSLQLVGNSISSIEGLVHMRMAGIQMLYLRMWADKIDENNIISVRVARKAVWPALQLLSFDDSYFGDGGHLVHGYFPRMEALFMYITWEEEEQESRLTEQCFPAKMQTTSLQRLGIGENKFCFERSRKRALQQNWRNVDLQ